MKKEWLQTLARMPYGLYVLTSRSGKSTGAMIASWVCQVSYAPPLIMAALHEGRYLHSLIRESGVFALNLLAKDQKEQMPLFLKPRLQGSLEDDSWFHEKTGCPLLRNALAYLECAVRETHTPGNHTLYIGELIDAANGRMGDPLMTPEIEGTYTGRD